MAHIVFIVNSYHPKFEGVGVCARNVVNELKIKNKVTVICKKTEFNQENSEEFEETQILRIETNLDNFRNYVIAKSQESYAVRKFILTLIGFLLRVYRYLTVIFSKVILERDDVVAYFNSLGKIHAEDKIDIVIPCSSRFESCIAAAKFTLINEEVKLVPYMFDNYATNISLYRNCRLFYNLKLDNHIALERFVIQESDKILCMKHYAESFIKIHKNIEKLIIVEHPLLVELDNGNDFNFDKEKINIVYTGTLYRKIRNPKYALSVLSNVIERNSEIILHIFDLGDCASMIKKFVKRHPNQIIYHGYVSNIIAESARNSADYLLSIGNISNNQLPGKTFEYMSALKPIIHFAKFKDDKTCRILSSYPNTCILIEDLDLMACNAARINHFFEEIKERISFEALKQIFPDAQPSYTAEKIEKYILNT